MTGTGGRGLSQPQRLRNVACEFTSEAVGMFESRDAPGMAKVAHYRFEQRAACAGKRPRIRPMAYSVGLGAKHNFVELSKIR